MAERDVRILHKRTSVPGKIPTGTTGYESNLIRQGEIAINTSDKKIFSFDGSGIFEFGVNSFLGLSGGTINGNLNVTGDTLLQTVSANTIYSGSTNLYNIFKTQSEFGSNISGITNYISLFNSTSSITNSTLTQTTGGTIVFAAGTANNAPLKLTSGNLLLTTEPGAIEYNGDDYYASIATPPLDTVYITHTPVDYGATSYLDVVFSPDKCINNVHVTGSYGDEAWISNSQYSQRFHFDLGVSKVVNRIYYENLHSNGSVTGAGVKNFTFWGSNTSSDFNDYVYNNDGTWVQLTTDQSTFEQHVGFDVADPKYILVNNTTSYRYYAFKFLDSWTLDDGFVGLRCLSIQYGSSNYRKGIILNDGINLTFGKIPLATTNGRLIDSLISQSGDNISISGDTSLQTLSATTIFSGSTDLYNIFSTPAQNNGAYVHLSGDTMTGTLILSAQSITATPLQLISGDLIGQPQIGTVEFSGDFYSSDNSAYYESVYPPDFSNTYTIATSNGTGSAAYYPFDKSLSLTGTMIATTWFSALSTIAEQRLHVDLGVGRIINRIYYENNHSTGGLTDRGVQNFTLWGSNSASSFSNVTYSADTGWKQITGLSQTCFDRHIDLDQSDPKYITINNNTTAYRYYAFKFIDNYGSTSYIAIKRIELQTNVFSQYPVLDANHVKATSTNTTYYPHIACNPSISLTGTGVATTWMAGASTNQRFNIDLNLPKIINQIYYQNYHTLGGTTDRGAKNFTFYGSNDVNDFNDTAYTGGTNWAQINCPVSAFTRHVDIDQSDPQYINITGNTNAYRYYSFKFANNYGASVIGLKRVELQSSILNYRKRVVLTKNENPLTLNYIPRMCVDGICDSIIQYRPSNVAGSSGCIGIGSEPRAHNAAVYDALQLNGSILFDNPQFRIHAGTGTTSTPGYILDWTQSTNTLLLGGSVGSGTYLSSNHSSATASTYINWYSNSVRRWGYTPAGFFIGNLTPASALHIDQGNGIASALKFTNGTTTGQLATDGFDVGIDTFGTAEIRQRENLNMLFYTNNTQRLSIFSSGTATFANKVYANSFEVVTNLEGYYLNTNKVLYFNSAMYTLSSPSNQYTLTIGTNVPQLLLQNAGGTDMSTTSTTVYNKIGMFYPSFGTYPPKFSNGLHFYGDYTGTHTVNGDRRVTTGDGYGMYLQANGCYLGGTNLVGGNLYLRPGVGTGSGNTSSIFLQTLIASSSSTLDNTFVNSIIVANSGITINNNLDITGDTSLQALSATTFISGSTDLYNIFQTVGSDLNKTYLQSGLNTYTGGTEDNPFVNVSAATLDTLSVSGETSLGVVSAITLYSGSTDLYNIFSTPAQNNGTYVHLSGDTMTGNLNIFNANLNVTGNTTITGDLIAATKSFVIKHPTKEGKKLHYGSLEGPEHGVYFRGRLIGEDVICLPEYWPKLVNEYSISVNLTAFGRPQKLWVKKIENNKIYISHRRWNTNVDCFYTVFAMREKINVEE